MHVRCAEIHMFVKLAMVLVGNTLTWEKYMIMAEV